MFVLYLFFFYHHHRRRRRRRFSGWQTHRRRRQRPIGVPLNVIELTINAKYDRKNRVNGFKSVYTLALSRTLSRSLALVTEKLRLKIEEKKITNNKIINIWIWIMFHVCVFLLARWFSFLLLLLHLLLLPSLSLGKGRLFCVLRHFTLFI